jgi:DNA-binding Lrp family transcriptional regulator
MDEIDKKILNMMQEEFPVTERPFAELGRRAGISEEEALERTRKAKEEGYIRRIGPVLEPGKLAYESTLCGVHVEKDLLMDVVKQINAHSGVTHNYERDGELNLWFTVTAKSFDDIETFLGEIERQFSLTIFRFPKKRVFKIKTFFPL